MGNRVRLQFLFELNVAENNYEDAWEERKFYEFVNNEDKWQERINRNFDNKVESATEKFEWIAFMP